MQRIGTFFVCLSIVGVTLIAGCVRIPPGPNVMVLPGSGKSFDTFERDDRVCRDWAAYQSHPDARRANDRAVADAAVGTVVGAAAGAAIGAAAGDPAMGAAAGAGAGLLGGTLVGADESNYASWAIQRRYDNAYVQCMYAKGNQVPVPRSSQAAAAYRPPLPHDTPPPPRGRPPQPPPGY